MRNNYGCDLDSLTTGSRIGMMRSATGDLHYYINGVDQGVACTGLPPGNREGTSETRGAPRGETLDDLVLHPRLPSLPLSMCLSQRCTP